MEKFRKTIYVILSIIAVIVAIASLLSILRNTESRYLKMLDFPRIQFFITSLVSLILFVLLTKKWQWYDHLLLLALFCGLLVNGSYIIHYTPLVEPTVPTAKASDLTSDNQVGILLANVKMSNREARPLLHLIESERPDIIIAMEVDDWWNIQLTTIEKDYPYQQKSINEVTYGMSLYSKMPLDSIQVNYLNNRKVPSFRSMVRLKNGKKFILYSVHPVPPTRFEDLPDNKGQEEIAMTKLGSFIKDRKFPVIVAGDFNDVSWGATDKLTETTALLSDVRVGRGFYNSYNADNILLRWPLDHVLVTEEFKLVDIERLSDISSDHYPIFVKLAL